MRYQGEYKPDDLIEVTLWEDLTDPEVIHFHISKDKNVIKIALFKFMKTNETSNIQSHSKGNFLNTA